MMNVSIASAPPTPVAQPPEERIVSFAGKAFWCFNPMANRRQAALEAQVQDLTSKLEEAMKTQGVLSEQLLDSMTKHNALEQNLTKVQAENNDLRKAGVSFRRMAAWKIKNQFSRAIADGCAA